MDALDSGGQTRPAPSVVPGPTAPTAGAGTATLDRPLLDVVVPTCGRPDRAIRCVESVLAATWDEARSPMPTVLLVDNAPTHPTDAPRLRAFAAQHERVRYVPCARPGASAARNEGVRHSRAELVAFTDDDTVVDARWLQSLVDPFDDPSVVCVTGLVLPFTLETRAQELFESYGGFAKGDRPRRFDLDVHDQGPLYPFSAGVYGSGNNVALRRSWLVAGRGYDEALGPGTPTQAGEDLDLFVRVVAGGSALVYAPQAVVRHEHRADEAALRAQLHGYGRGLTAMLVALVVHDPAMAWQIVRRVPAGLVFMLSPTSAKNRGRDAGYPRALVRAELAGCAIGPLTYLSSRARRAWAHR